MSYKRFDNKCPYTNRKCHNNWDCHYCEVEEKEEDYMRALDDLEDIRKKIEEAGDNVE